MMKRNREPGQLVMKDYDVDELQPMMDFAEGAAETPAEGTKSRDVGDASKSRESGQIRAFSATETPAPEDGGAAASPKPKRRAKTPPLPVQTPLDDDLRLYKLRELETVLGLCRKTLNRYIRDGLLRATKIGQGWRVTQADLREFIRRQGVK